MKLLISSCLLGKPVRYDGGSKRIDGIELLSRYHELYPVCPEVLGGLAIPRESAEISGSAEDILRGRDGSILTNTGVDVTESFLEGAGKTLAYCQEMGITGAILTDHSPSCGSTMIYDGTHTGRKIPGMGLTACLLRENGIRLFTETTWKQLLPEDCDFL